MAQIKSLGMAKQENDWETEDAMRCLMRAEEIKKDKKLMAKVSSMAKEKLLKLADIAADATEYD